MLTNLPKQSQEIAEKILNETYECLVCLNNIKKEESIWTCKKCYSIFHFNCILNWSENKNEWICPFCREIQKYKPKQSCYCGKSLNGNKFSFPHSCGNFCGKIRKGTTCKHPCSHICHPGPCPPCSYQGKTISCFCGKSKKQQICGESDTFCCNKMCLKRLPCGHACKSICHSGPCPKCTVSKEVTCYCGKHKENKLCSECINKNENNYNKKGRNIKNNQNNGYFSCNEICGAKLSCGNHFCTKKCHSINEKHSECPTPITLTTCPCGKTKIDKRNSCLDEIKCCDNICGKQLPCGHFCKSKCHLGECPKCEEVIEIYCRCGEYKKGVLCGGNEKTFECNTVCGEILSCGTHVCKRICCPAKNEEDTLGLHKCTNICNKPLSCGKHNCQMICHKGKCQPCRKVLNESISCACGKSVIPAPIICGTLPPVCHELCNKQQPCGHKLQPHLCHFGPCPKCVELIDKLCFCGKKSY